MSDSRGFTLVEVLIAGTLIASVLILTAGMMLTAHRTLDRSGAQTSAVVLAEQRIEWLRDQGYSSGALAAGTTVETLSGTYAGFTRTTTVVDGAPATGMKQITVRCTTASGVTVEITSLIGES